MLQGALITDETNKRIFEYTEIMARQWMIRIIRSFGNSRIRVWCHAPIHSSSVYYVHLLPRGFETKRVNLVALLLPSIFLWFRYRSFWCGTPQSTREASSTGVSSTFTAGRGSRIQMARVYDFKVTIKVPVVVTSSRLQSRIFKRI